MSSITIDALMKKRMIESQASNGKCYIRLIPLVPAFKTSTLSNLESAIVNMTSSLGSNPAGLDVLVELWFANDVMSESVDSELPDDLLSSQFIKDMMNSDCRFSFEDVSGVKHIGHYLENDTCEDSNEIFCTHGWASRFVLCALVVHGTLVGAQVDLDELFASLGGQQLNLVEEEHESDCDDSEYSNVNTIKQIDNIKMDTINNFLISNEFQHKPNNVDNLTSKVDDQYREIERLTNKVKSLETKSKIENGHSEVKQTVLPTDSSSQIGRYNKKFMNQGSVYNVRNGRTLLEVETVMNKPSFIKESVRGYLKTEKMEALEQKTLKRVKPINGLAKPFCSNRLNLLCHFHTAIDSLKPQSGTYSNYDAINFLSNFQSKTPSEELAYQMITNTFDLKNNVVIANPYKIPFLEIGMLISDDSLAKSLDLLRLEYKILWFEEMKSLMIPDFHSSYKKHREYKVTKTSATSKAQATSSRTSARSQSDRKGTSMLSFIRA